MYLLTVVAPTFFFILLQERNESSAPTEDIDNRRPPQNAVVAPVLTVAAPPRVNKRRISRRAKSFDSASPCAQTFTGDARSRNDDTSLPVLEKESGGANDAGIGLDRSEDEAGVAAVAAIANAARAARASAAAGEMAAGKGATGEEEGGGELSALRGFATPSAVGRPAMAPYSVSDTSEFWDLEENTISPDEGNSIQRTGAGYSTVGAGDTTATPRAGQPGLGRGGQHDGEAAPVGEDGGTTDGVAQLVLDPDEEDSFASQDSGFGTVAVNGEMTRDTKGPSPESDNERRRLSGASGNGLGWRGKLESTSGGAVEISDGARPVNGSGEWSCKLVRTGGFEIDRSLEPRRVLPERESNLGCHSSFFFRGLYVCVILCVFIGLKITAQPGPVVLISLRILLKVAAPSVVVFALSVYCFFRSRHRLVLRILNIALRRLKLDQQYFWPLDRHRLPNRSTVRFVRLARRTL